MLGELERGALALGEERRRRIVANRADPLFRQTGQPCGLVADRLIELGLDELGKPDTRQLDDDRVRPLQGCEVVVNEDPK